MYPSSKLSLGTTSKSPAPGLQATEDKEVCHRQLEDTCLGLKSGTLSRRHSADGTIGSDSEPAAVRGPENRFHPYRRQLSDGVMEAASCLRQSSSSFGSLQEMCSPEVCSLRSDAPATWDQYSNSSSTQSFCSDPPATRMENPSFLSQRHSSYGTLSPVQQISSKLYSGGNHPNNSKYSLQSFSSQSHSESTTQSTFPKPIYSYSILIFMALKNSKTGSLPVSEIYSFMTEHFPYFKTAPDGWKNSVRHNLSLNKCFEKVENKNGSTSRKGCLWALNPAKVEKMQEELHKWRRKDPLTVRRSMARPEDLDRLLGERPNKGRSLPPYTGSTSRVATSATCTPARFHSTYQHTRRSQYGHVESQQPFYLSPAVAQPSSSFSLYSPCEQLPAAGIPTAPEILNSPTAARMPSAYSAALQAEYSASSRSMQELMLLEGDISYDIDTLNPSLTDLQLHGNVWEELREDSLASESYATTAPPATFVLQDHYSQTSYMQFSPSFGHMSAGTAGGRCKVEYEDKCTDRSCWNGLHPVGYSGVESLAGYLTSCTTPLSLM